ncbi:MAG: hypothetical protein DME32_06400, partial [Verrucomicrobia bacterium]
ISDKFGHENCVNLRDSCKRLRSMRSSLPQFYHAITAKSRKDAKCLNWVRLPYALRLISYVNRGEDTLTLQRGFYRKMGPSLRQRFPPVSGENSGCWCRLTIVLLLPRGINLRYESIICAKQGCRLGSRLPSTWPAPRAAKGRTDNLQN